MTQKNHPQSSHQNSPTLVPAKSRLGKDLLISGRSSYFTFGMNVKNPRHTSLMSLEDIVTGIENGVAGEINVRYIVDRIRSTDSKDVRTRLKLKLPWFSGGCFTHGRCMNDLIQNNYLILDVDDVVDPEGSKSLLELADKSLTFAFTSPSGGLKLVYRPKNPITEDISYSRAYRYLVQDLWQKMGLKADEAAKSRAQACYFGYDPKLWINPDFKPLAVEDLPEDEQEQRQMRSSGVPEYNSNRSATPEYYASTSTPATFEEDYALARNIVSYLADCREISYEHWRKTAFALKSRFGEYGKSLFLIYAENVSYNDDVSSLSRYWESLDTPHSIGFPSLVYVAHLYGWQAT